MDFKEELAGMNLPGHFVEAVTAAYGALVESESVLTAKVTFNNEDSAFDALESLNKFKELNIHPECSGYIDEVEFSKDGCSIVLKSASADALKYVKQFTEEADEDALVGDSTVLESIGCPVFEGTANSEQMVERLINWVTHAAPFPRDKVAEFIDANRTSHLVRCAMSADFFSSYQLVKYIGTWLGLPGYEEAETVDDVLKANQANRKEPLTEASGSPSGETLRMEPGWPEKDMVTDYSADFPQCPYAREFFGKLADRLSQFGTIVPKDKLIVTEQIGSRPKHWETDVKVAMLKTGWNQFGSGPKIYKVRVLAAHHGDRVAPFEYKEIGEIEHPGRNFEIKTRLEWHPGFYTGVKQDEFMITPENIDEAVEKIVGYVKEYTEQHQIDMERAELETNAHYRWLSRRAMNVTDTEVGRKFLDLFDQLAAQTEAYTVKDWKGAEHESHLVGMRDGDNLNGIAVNKVDLVYYKTNDDGEFPARIDRAYTVRCTSDGAVALIGNRENLDYGTVMLTDSNWEEVCHDVFRELVSLGKQQLAKSKVLAQKEAERQAKRVPSDRNRIRNKFGDYIYNKFFDVVDDGELAGKSTDEIITDIKCAIAEDRSEYDLLAKQDRIRAGKE